MNSIIRDILPSPDNFYVSLLAAGLVVFAIYKYYKFQNALEYWSKRGIKGPKPSFPAGNFFDISTHRRPNNVVKWRQEHGKVYGVYFGSSPILVISEPETINQICIKDFDAFTDHRGSDFFSDYQKNFIFMMKAEDRWKQVRALMSPTFTSSKLRRMFSILDDCCDDLISCIDEQMKQDDSSKTSYAICNMKEVFNLYTMNGITTCCYGLRMQRAGTTDLKTLATRDDFVNAALKIFDIRISRFLFSVVLPIPLLKAIGYRLIPDSVFEPLVEKVGKVIESRKRQNDRQFNDYLQLLLDARLDHKLELEDTDKFENHHAGLQHETLITDQANLVKDIEMNAKTNSAEGKTPLELKKTVKLTEIEVLSGALMLLAVGLETTGNLLTHCSYVLAFHQDIQQKLYDEVKKIACYDGLKKRHAFDYDSIVSCHYLDAVISETLRMFSPVMQTDRIARRDYYLEKYKLTIPKGSQVIMDFYGIHNDPSLWPEPRRFDPDRFMPGNKEKIVPCSYLPFGVGPRHCIGMRFSLAEAKLALARSVMAFKFEIAPGTRYPPDHKVKIGLYSIKNPLVKISPR